MGGPPWRRVLSEGPSNTVSSEQRPEGQGRVLLVPAPPRPAVPAPSRHPVGTNGARRCSGATRGRRGEQGARFVWPPPSLPPALVTPSAAAGPRWILVRTRRSRQCRAAAPCPPAGRRGGEARARVSGAAHLVRLLRPKPSPGALPSTPDPRIQPRRPPAAQQGVRGAPRSRGLRPRPPSQAHGGT